MHQNTSFNTSELKSHLVDFLPSKARYKSPDARLRARNRIIYLSKMLDSSFEVPGTGQRFGWDGLIGLVPGIGDGITAVLAFYIIYEAKRAGVSKLVLSRMVGRSLFDLFAGIVPIIGDMWDFMYKSNSLNAQDAIDYLDSRKPEQSSKK